MRRIDKAFEICSRLRRAEEGHSWLEFALVGLLMCVVFLLLLMAVVPSA